MTNYFIPRVQNWINISKSINIIHRIEKKRKITMIILIDAEKVSDKTSVIPHKSSQQSRDGRELLI